MARVPDLVRGVGLVHLERDRRKFLVALLGHLARLFRRVLVRRLDALHTALLAHCGPPLRSLPSGAGHCPATSSSNLLPRSGNHRSSAPDGEAATVSGALLRFVPGGDPRNPAVARPMAKPPPYRARCCALSRGATPVPPRWRARWRNRHRIGRAAALCPGGRPPYPRGGAPDGATATVSGALLRFVPGDGPARPAPRD